METIRGMNDVLGTTEEIVKAQQDAYTAMANNVAAFQRDGSEFARSGLEFLRLQENNVQAARRMWSSGMELMRVQQRNVEFMQGWMGDGAEFMRAQTERNRHTAEAVLQSARKQQESFRGLAENWVGAYRSFFESFVNVGQQGIQATQEVTEQGLRLANEAAEQTGEAMKQAAEAARQAELQAAVYGALKTEEYEKLTVAEISGRLDKLTDAEIEKIREYEKSTKNRETLVEQIDRKLRNGS